MEITEKENKFVKNLTTEKFIKDLPDLIKIINSREIPKRPDLLTKLKQTFQKDLPKNWERQILYKIVKSSFLTLPRNPTLLYIWENDISLLKIYRELGHAQFLRLQGIENLVGYNHNLREDISRLSHAVEIAQNIETAKGLLHIMKDSKDNYPKEICWIYNRSWIYPRLEARRELFQKIGMHTSKKDGLIHGRETKCYNAAQKKARNLGYDLIVHLGSRVINQNLESDYELWKVKPWAERGIGTLEE